MATAPPADSGEPPVALDLPALARRRAREHAADLVVVARERAYLNRALAGGQSVEELAADLRITPRAIRHLLTTPAA